MPKIERPGKIGRIGGTEAIADDIWIRGMEMLRPAWIMNYAIHTTWTNMVLWGVILVVSFETWDISSWLNVSSFLCYVGIFFGLRSYSRSDGIGDVNLNLLQLLISDKLVEFKAYAGVKYCCKQYMQSPNTPNHQIKAWKHWSNYIGKNYLGIYFWLKVLVKSGIQLLTWSDLPGFNPLFSYGMPYVQCSNITT